MMWHKHNWELIDKTILEIPKEFRDRVTKIDNAILLIPIVIHIFKCDKCGQIKKFKSGYYE